MEPQAPLRRDIKREILDMTPSDQSMLAGPESEMREPDRLPDGGIRSETELTLSSVFSTGKRFATQAVEIVEPEKMLRCRKSRIFTDMTGSISPDRMVQDGMVQSPETPKGELRKEMTDMTPSVFISHATTEAAKYVTEEIGTQGTSKDYLRNEKVDMMPSIYILGAHKKAAETIDLSETSSRTDEEEEEEFHLPESHKGRNLLQCTLNSLNGQKRKDMSLNKQPPVGGEEAGKECTVLVKECRASGKPKRQDDRRPVGRPRKHDSASVKPVSSRPRGRPRKHDSPSVKPVSSRPRGRPRKHDSPSVKPVSSRPRGRPRKHDSPSVKPVSSRSRGRPRKHDSASVKPVSSRSRGRPRKHDSSSVKPVSSRPRGRPRKHDSPSFKPVSSRPIDSPHKHDSLEAVALRPTDKRYKLDSFETVAQRSIDKSFKYDSLEAVAPTQIDRPCKLDSLEAAAQGPKDITCKHDSLILKTAAPRKRGRPRKHDSIKPKTASPRPRGRPRKHDSRIAVSLRPRGRPPKDDSCMAVEVCQRGIPCDHNSLLSHMSAAGRARSRPCEHDSIMTLDDGDDGSEDGHRADVLTEEALSDDDQFRRGTKIGRASTVFDSPSICRQGITIPPTIVIVNTPNGVIISESKTGSNGEASIVDMILKPVRVDICRDEVKEYLNRKYVGTRHSKDFYCLKRIEGKKCFVYEPKPKKKGNQHRVCKEQVKQKAVDLSPGEANSCLSRKWGVKKAPIQIHLHYLQCEMVEKAKKNVKIQNISGSRDIGHFTKTLPKSQEKLIYKCTDPSENMDKEQEPALGRNGRKRRKVVTPEENLGTEIDYADGQNEAEVVDEKQVYIDEDWTEEYEEDDNEFDEHLLVTFQPGEGQFVLQGVDKEQMIKDTEKIIPNKALVQQNVVKEEVDQTVAKKPDEDQFGEQFLVQKKGQFENKEQEQTVICKDLENIIVGKCEEEESNVVKEIAEESVVHREEDWVVVLQEEEQQTREGEDEDKCVLQGEDKEQLLVKGEREQIVIDDERIVMGGRVEQTVLDKEVEEQTVVYKEVQDQGVVKEAEHIVIQEEQEDCVVVDEEVEEQIVVKGRVEQIVIHETVDDCIVIEQEGEPSMVTGAVQQNGVIFIND